MHPHTLYVCIKKHPEHFHTTDENKGNLDMFSFSMVGIKTQVKLRNITVFAFFPSGCLLRNKGYRFCITEPIDTVSRKIYIIFLPKLIFSCHKLFRNLILLLDLLMQLRHHAEGIIQQKV